MDATASLKEQPDIKALIYVLESNGLKKEQKEVENLVDYLEGMENQFIQMMGELKEVRSELAKIQDKGIRAAVTHVVSSAESKVQEIRGQVSLIRQNLSRSARNAVAAFKEKGTDALRKAVSSMKIPNVLSLMKNMLHRGAEYMNGRAEKTEMIGVELHKAAGHRRNVGRILIGRQTKEPMERMADKGVLATVKKAFLACGKMYLSMEKNTENALKRMEQFCKGEEKRTSVKLVLKQIKSGRSTEREIKSIAPKKER